VASAVGGKESLGAAATLLVAVAVADSLMVGRELVLADTTGVADALEAGAMGELVAALDDPVDDVHPETAVSAVSRPNERASVRAPFGARDLLGFTGSSPVQSNRSITQSLSATGNLASERQAD